MGQRLAGTATQLLRLGIRAIERTGGTSSLIRLSVKLNFHDLFTGPCELSVRGGEGARCCRAW
jgi:hypothetical protein